MNKYRIGTDIPFRVQIAEGDNAFDWADITVKQVAMYSDSRQAFAGLCTHEVNGDDSTWLDCIYPASVQVLTGALRLVVIFEMDGRTLTYDLADVFALVGESAEADSDGDTVTDAHITVSGLPISVISEILNACIAATAAANDSVIEEITYTPSTADGGDNILTIKQAGSAAQSFTIKNGSKGSTGDTGAKGDAGTNGTDGVGIASVTQTTTSTESGGTNVITVTKTDGTTSTFQVKNGAQGAPGPQGNEEDIDQNEDGKLQFANRNYNSQNPDGMGYVILRKNKTFAEQVTQDNTIYEIRYDFDLNGGSVTIPAGCVLQFNGGSIINGTLDLNSDCLVTGQGIKCEITNPPANETRLSLYLGNTSDPQLNHSVLQEMIDSGVGIIVDTPDLTISDYLEVKTNLKIVGVVSRIPKLTFPNSKGFVWTAIVGSVYNRVENIEVIALDNAFDFVNGGAASRPNNIYFSSFTDLRVRSDNGHCFYAGNNKGANGDTCLFDNVFDSIYVIAPLGCGFYGISGNTHRFVKCRSGKCGVAVFYNCAGHFDSFNGTWGLETPTFFKAEGTSTSPVRLRCEFINCNFESFQSIIFDCAYSTYTYMHLSFVGCTFYVTPNGNAVIDYYPMRFGYLYDLFWRNCTINIYNNGSYDSTHSFWYVERFQNCNYDVDESFKVYYHIGASLYNSTMIPIVSTLGSGVVSSQYYNQSYKKCNKMELGFARVNTLIKTAKQIDITSVSSPYLDMTSADWREAFVFKHSSALDVDATHNISYFGNPSILATEIWIKVNGTLSFFVKNGNTNRKISFSSGNSNPGGFLTKDGSTIVLKPGQCAKFSLVYVGGAAKYLVEPYDPTNLGVGASRPATSLYIGMQFYDTTLNKPIWYKGGGEWVDATGATV